MTNKNYVNTYDLSDTESMIDLAIKIQSKVYWGMSFEVEGEDNKSRYSDFWQYVQFEKLNNGITHVSIDSNEVVRFIVNR